MSEVEFSGNVRENMEWVVSEIQSINYDNVSQLIVTYNPPRLITLAALEKRYKEIRNQLDQLVPNHVKIIIKTSEIKFEFVRDYDQAYKEGKKAL